MMADAFSISLQLKFAALNQMHARAVTTRCSGELLSFKQENVDNMLFLASQKFEFEYPQLFAHFNCLCDSLVMAPCN